LKSLCRNSPQNESLRSRFQLLPTSAWIMPRIGDYLG
jgi:hypothetical protein